jgi:hypothetical protein
MQFTSERFMSAEFNNFIESGNDFEEGCWDGEYGYFLIDGCLVPYSFIERLYEHLTDNPLHYDQIISIENICGSENWASLNMMERKMVGPCILILLESFLLVEMPK